MRIDKNYVEFIQSIKGRFYKAFIMRPDLPTKGATDALF